MNRARYGWMSLGGLLCLLGIVAACKFRDGNRAHAQSEPPLIEKKVSPSNEPPLADPASNLPPVDVAVQESPNQPTLSRAVTPSSGDVRLAVMPLSGEEKKGDTRPAEARAPLGSEPRPILIPTSANAAPPPSVTESAPAPMPGAVPPSSVPLNPPPAAPKDVPPPPPGGKVLPPIQKPSPEVKIEPGPKTATDQPAPVVPVTKDVKATPPTPTVPKTTVTPVSARASVPATTVEPGVRPLPPLRCRPAPKPKVVLPLTGTYPLRLDEHKALALPKAILEQLGRCDTVLMSPGSDRCLWLTNQAHLDRLAAKLDRSPARESDVRGFRRLYYAQTVKVPIKDGRVIISDKLAQFAGLGQDVVLVGIDDHFEVWDTARWKRYTQTKKASPLDD